MKLVIIDYGAGNIKSLQFAFQRLGIDAILTNTIEKIVSAIIDFSGCGRSEHRHGKAQSLWFGCGNPTVKAACFGNLLRNAAHV